MKIDRAFHGKDKALVFTYEEGNNKSIFMNIGKKNGEKWEWIKCKISDEECGNIIQVLRGNRQEVSFFHKSVNKEGVEQTKNILISRLKDDNAKVIVSINKVSKLLTFGEQEVLRVLMEKVIIECNTKS